MDNSSWFQNSCHKGRRLGYWLVWYAVFSWHDDFVCEICVSKHKESTCSKNMENSVGCKCEWVKSHVGYKWMKCWIYKRDDSFT